MTRTGWRAPILLMAASVGACSEPSDCTQVEAPAVVAAVRDAITNELITDGSSGEIAAGTFRATFGPYELNAQSKAISLAAFAPSGTYNVVLHRVGYARWDSVVNVSSDLACQGDRTQRIVARLDRE